MMKVLIDKKDLEQRLLIKYSPAETGEILQSLTWFMEEYAFREKEIRATYGDTPQTMDELVTIVLEMIFQNSDLAVSDTYVLIYRRLIIVMSELTALLSVVVSCVPTPIRYDKISDVLSFVFE